MFIYTLKCTIDFVLLTIITGDDFFSFGLFNHKEKHDHHTELPFFYVFMQEDSEIEVMQKMTREELEYHQNNSIHSIILALKIRRE